MDKRTMLRKRYRVLTVILILFFWIGHPAFGQSGITGPNQMNLCDQQTYTLTVDNQSPDAACNLVVTSTLPNADFTYVAGTGNITGLACGSSEPTVNGTNLVWDIDALCGNTQLDPNHSFTITYEISTNCNTVSGSNPVQIDYTNCPNGDPLSDSDSLSIEILPGDVVISKTPAVVQAAIGEDATWTVTVENTGLGTIENVVVTDVLQSGLAYVSSAPAGTNAGDTTTWTSVEVPALASIDPGDTVSFTITATVVSCENLDNNADVSWSCTGGDTCYDSAVDGGTATASVELVRHSPDLDIAPGPIAFNYCEGSLTDREVVITNNGDGVSFADDGDGNHAQLCVDFGGLNVSNIWPAGVTYTNGCFSLPEIAANGGDVTIQYDLSYVDLCAGPGSGSLIWQPRYYDECGNEFLSPVTTSSYSGPADIPSLTVAKTGPSEVEIGSTIDYHLVVDYAGPTSCNGNTTGPVTVTDTIPDGFTVTDAGGGTVNGNTITWTYDPAADPHFETDITLQVPSDCATFCNRVVTNTLEATVTDCCNCVRSASDTANTAIECQGGVADVDKTVAPSPIQTCESFNYTNTYTFTNDAQINGVNLDTISFSEDAANNQQYEADSLNVTFDNNDITNCITIADNTPGGTLDLDFSNCVQGTPIQNSTLEITYTLTHTDASNPNPGCGSTVSWYDWSTLDLGIAGAGCLTDGQLHETVQPSVEPPAMTINVSGFPALMSTCETFDVDITIDRTTNIGMPYDVELRLDTNNYYIVNVIGYDGINPNSGPTDHGAYVSLDYGDLFTGANTQGIIHATVRKQCAGGAEFSATLYYNDHCADDGNSDQECHASFNYSPPVSLTGRVIIEKNPEIIQAANNQVQWTIYVTSTGTGPARNVWVDDILGAGLSIVSATPSGAGATVTLGQDHTGAAINGASIIFSELAAAERREIILVADVIDCDGLTNTVTTSSGCNGNDPSDGWDQDCPDSVGDSASVVVPEGKLIVTSHLPTPMASCSQNTGTITIRNSGVTTLYHLDVAQTLPAGLTYVPGTTVVGGAAGSDPNPITSPMHWTEAELPDLASIDPGQVIEIQYDVTVDCGFTGGDTETEVNYKNLCGEDGTPATGNFSVQVTAPDLSVVKVRTAPAEGEVIDCGDAVTWEIRVTNNGPDSVPVVWVEDILGDFFTITGHSGGADDGHQVDDQHVQWEIANLAGHATTTLTLNATADSAPCGEHLDNVARAFWGCGVVDGDSSTRPVTDECSADPNAADYCCLSGISVEDTHTSTREPDIDMGLVIDAAPFDTCGGTSTVEATITNNGTTDASFTDLVLTLPAGLAYNGNTTITCSSGGGGSGDPALSGPDNRTMTFYNTGTTGGGNDLCNTIAGDGGEATVSFEVISNCSEGGDITGTLFYYDCCGDTQYQTNGSAPIAPQYPDLSITKTPAGNQVDCGDDQTWTITVTNNGDGNAQVVRIEDTPGAWIDVNLGSSTAGLTAMDNGVYGWEINNLAAGDSLNLTFVGTLNPDGNDCTEALRHNQVRAMWGCGTAGQAGDGNPNTQTYDCSDDTWVNADAYGLQMPDLQVGNISVDFSCDADNHFDGTITVTIDNDGDAPTLHDATVTLVYDGAAVGTGPVTTGLAAGASTDVTIDTSGWNVDCTVCTAGTFTATVDSEGDECECDESNNTGTLDYTCASYGNLAWEDLNANGIQDAGEPGIENVTVTLYGHNGNLIGSTTTDDSGNYQFSNLWPGDYYAVFDVSTAVGTYLPTGQDQGGDTVDSDADTGTGQTIVTTLDPGEDDPTWDAGYYQPCSVGDYVWVDTNGDGIQDPLENGIGGVTVTLTGTDGLGNPVTLTTTTNPDGSYLFEDLVPGSYQITFTPPAGYAVTLQDQGGDDAADSDANPANGQTIAFDLVSGQHDPTWDCGIYETASLGNYVWLDTNADGVQDVGETGIDGVTVNLFHADGTPAGSTTTAGGGLYEFTDLAPGDYYVEFVPPAGYIISPQDSVGDDTIDSDADPATHRTIVTTLESGENDPTWDAGMYQTASLGDYVWNDLNADGVQDGGESGIGNVTVNLYDGDGNLVDTTTTNGTGFYEFTDLLPGDYSVDFIPPAGYLISPQDQGDDTTDSDADPITGRTIQTTLDAGENDPTWDAGVYQLASIGDYVWFDVDADGIQDGGESGIGNVTVNLYDGAGNLVDTTTTAGTGFYEFTDLVPGDYSVEFIPPAGYSLSPQDQGGDDTVDSDANPATGRTIVTTLIAGENDPTWDAGVNLVTASLGDYVWNDLNADGIQDPGETGIGNVTVNLYDGAGNLIDTTTTAPDGSYSFAGLTPGDYSVEFIPPAGYVLSPQDQGGDDTTDSDADPATGRTVTTTLDAGENDPTWDAGVYQLASIGDYVWTDTNGNGVQDAGESGIDGVTVNLFHADGTPAGTTTTAGGGLYEFTDLVPGDYYVEFIPPAGYSISPQDQGGDDATDSDVNPATGRTITTTLIAGENDPTWDAGIYEPASLGDYVWDDVDADGIQDPGETGVGNVTVNLYDGNGNLVDTTTTAPDGSYGFTDLAPGDYEVEFIPPTGYSISPQNQGGDDNVDSDANPSTGRTGPISLESGENDPNWDAGINQTTASLGDYVWNDLNADGIQDPGETGIGNVTVNLYDGAGNLIDTTTTAPDGSYSFAGLTPGDYSVEFIPPAGYVLSPQDQGGDDTADSDADPATGRTVTTTLDAGENDPTWDAGVYQLASIGDYVWTDTNGDGVQDAGESGIDGVTVNLFHADGTPAGTTTTAGGGLYEFTDLVPGDYYVEFIPPAGYSISPQDQGGDDATDSDVNPATGRTITTTLIAGENDPTWDAGIYEPASLGDYIWDDVDADGIQDPGETGVGNVTVNLYDGNGNLVDTTTTAPDGSYGFTDLAPGDYEVEFIPPAGYSISPQNQGADDSVDSDANPSTGRTGPISLESGENDPNWDAGINQTTASLGDYVWNDLNADGIQDPGETGIGNVTVNLYDGAGNLIDTTTTAPDGSYSFAGLTPGDYSVEFIPPAGYVLSPQDQGSDDTADSDADPATGRTINTTLAAGQNDPTWDAGVFQPASIGDYVWTDTNGDGIQDAAESGIDGVTVNLFHADGTPAGSTVTAGGGLYQFTDLVPGDYYVEFTPPAGYNISPRDQGGDDAADSDADPATHRTITTTLDAGENDPTWDAGIYEPASLGDFVWQDLDGDGQQDSGEPGIDGVTVNLYDGSGNLVGTTTTSGGGAYRFTNLPPGDYVVEFIPPAGLIFSPPNNIGDDTADSDANPTTGRTTTISLSSGENDPNWDAGLFAPASVGDTIWYDWDGDGVQDPGESGISGVTVRIYDATTGALIGTTVTDGNGHYLFEDLPPGNYRIDVDTTTLPAGLDPTYDLDGGLNSTTTFALAYGEDKRDVDFGYRGNGVIGDTIWRDENGDGVEDPGEPGIAGVRVVLEADLDGDGIPDFTIETVTDANGNYLFEHLPPGDYTVRVDSSTIPGGLVQTGDPDDTTDGVSHLTLGNGEINLEQDFGYFPANPAIDIEKSTNGEDADRPTGPRVNVGSTVTWTYVVTNTGTTGLINITVTDDKIGTVNCPDTTLDPGASMTCTATGTARAGQYENNASVVGTPVDGNGNPIGSPVSDADPSHYIAEGGGIHLEKRTNGVDADTPSGPGIPSGNPVTWTYVVTNTGSLRLNDIRLSDDQGVSINCPRNSLAPGASMTCTGTGTAQAGQYKNTATVNGQPVDGNGNPVGNRVGDSDPSHYFGLPPDLPPVIIDDPSRMSPIPFNAELRGKECCLSLRMEHVTMSKTQDVIPVEGSVWLDTYNSMFAAAEFAGLNEELSGWLRAEGIDPDHAGLVSKRYMRTVDKAGMFAAFNVGNMTMQSGLGLGIAIAPDVRVAAKEKGLPAEQVAGEILQTMATDAGLTKMPTLYPRVLEYAGGVPIYRRDPARGDLSWDRSQMDKALVPLVWGTTLAAQAQLLPEYISSNDPTQQFAGKVMAWLMAQKVKLIHNDLLLKTDTGAGYVAHAYRVKPSASDLDVTVKTDEVRLSDQAALLWGLSRMRASFASADVEPPAELDPLIGVVWETLERAYQNDIGTYMIQPVVTPYDVMLTSLALASLAGENSDLSMANLAGERLDAHIAFIVGKMIAEDGGVSRGYNFKKAQALGGVNTLADQAAVLRALLVHQNGLDAAGSVYTFMEDKLWDVEHGLYRDRSDWPMTSIYTPQGVGAVMGGIGKLALHATAEQRTKMLDHLSVFFETVVAQGELQQRGRQGLLLEGARGLISGQREINDLRRPIPVPSRRYRDDIIETGLGRKPAPVLVSEVRMNFIPLEAEKLQALVDSIDFRMERFGPRKPLFIEPIRLPKLGSRRSFTTASGMLAASQLMTAGAALAEQSRLTDDAFFADPAMAGHVATTLSEMARGSLVRLTMQSGNGIPLAFSIPVTKMAEAAGVTPEQALDDWLKKAAEQNGLTELPQALSPIYVEFSTGWPDYPDGLSEGWDVRGSDKSVSLAGLFQTLKVELQFMKTVTSGQSPADSALDGFLAQVTGLSVAAKVHFIEQALASAAEAGLSELPARFILVRDSAGKVLDLIFPDPASSAFARISLLGALGDFMAMDDSTSGLVPGYAELKGKTAEVLSNMWRKFQSRYVDESGRITRMTLADAGMAADTIGRMVQAMPDGYSRKPETVAMVKALAVYLVEGKTNGRVDEFLEGPATRESLADKAAVILGLIRAGDVLHRPDLSQTAVDRFNAFDRQYWSKRLDTYLASEFHETLKQVRTTRYMYSAEDIGLTIGALSRMMTLVDPVRKTKIAERLAAFTPHLVEPDIMAGSERMDPDHIRPLEVFLVDRQLVYDGDILTFRIVVENRRGDDPGCGDLDEFKVRNVLPPGIVYVPNSARLEDRPIKTHINGRSQTWTIDHLPMGDTVTITFQARVDKAMHNGVHRNRAESGGYCFHPVDGGSAAVCGTTDNDQVALGAVNRIKGRIFRDSDGDGRREPGDKGLAGIRVILDENRATDTDNTGTFWFDKLLPGVYQVRLDLLTLPEDLIPTTDTVQTVVLDAGKTYLVDFGLIRYKRVSGSVFEDRNGNGRRDANEPGVAAVRVRIRGTDDAAYTADDGRFRIEGIPETLPLRVIIDDRQPYAHPGDRTLRVEVK